MKKYCLPRLQRKRKRRKTDRDAKSTYRARARGNLSFKLSPSRKRALRVVSEIGHSYYSVIASSRAEINPPCARAEQPRYLPSCVMRKAGDAARSTARLHREREKQPSFPRQSDAMNHTRHMRASRSFLAYDLD